MDNDHHLCTSCMSHLTKETEIFLDRILQDQHIAAPDAEACLDDANQVQEKGHNLVVVERGRKAYVHGSRLLQCLFNIGLGLIACTTQIVVVS